MTLPPIILLALLAVSQPAPKDSYLLAPRFKSGDQSDYQLVARSNVFWSDPAAQHKTEVVQDVSIRLAVAAVDERNAAILSVVLTHLKVTRTEDGATSGIELTDSGLLREGDKPAPGSSIEAAPTGDALTEISSALIASVIRIEVAPDGRIANVTGLDKAAAAAAHYEREGGQILGLFAPGVVQRNLAGLWRFDEEQAPAPNIKAKPAFVPRRVGDTWTTTDLVPFAGSGTLKQVRTLHLDSAKDNILSISASGVSTLEAPATKPDATTALVTFDSKRDLFTARWDNANSRLISRSSATAYSATSTLASKKSETTIETQVEITRIEK